MDFFVGGYYIPDSVCCTGFWLSPRFVNPNTCLKEGLNKMR